MHKVRKLIQIDKKVALAFICFVTPCVCRMCVFKTFFRRMKHEKSGLIYDVLCPSTASTIEGISSFNDFLLKFLPWKQNGLFLYNTVKCQGNVLILVSSLQLLSVTSGASLASLHKNFFFIRVPRGWYDWSNISKPEVCIRSNVVVIIRPSVV